MSIRSLFQPTPDGLTAEEWKQRAMHAEARLLRMAATAADRSKEARRLRRNYRRQQPTYNQIVHRAKHDAELMYALFMSGTPTSRQRCLDDLGISKRRWSWARSLAQLAGIHDGDEFLSLPMPDVIRRLQTAVTHASNDDRLLRSYLPK